MVGSRLTNEEQRLATLRRYALLDSPSEEAFDRITRLAATCFEMPIALITLIDETRQWFKSRVGANATETARALAFCDYAIRGRDVMVVPDATLDVRFANHPYVAGEPGLRFYAGAPLLASDGSALGTVCVLDRTPRDFGSGQRSMLQELSSLVMAHVGTRFELLEATKAKNEYAAVIDASPSAIVIAGRDREIAGWNAGAARIFGYTASEVVGQRSRLWPPEVDAQAEDVWRRVLEHGEIFNRIKMTGVHKYGVLLELVLSAKPIFGDDGGIVAAACVIEDVSERVRQSRIERRRYEVLEAAASNAPIATVLDRLVANVEYAIPESIAMFSRLREGRLFHAASSDALPPAYANALEGMAIGPLAGSCGTAAYRGETVIVPSIENDPLWDGCRAAALAHGLHSCWSTPIRNAANDVLGTLAVYSSVVREPTTTDLRFLHETVHVAAIAIEASDARTRIESMAYTDALTGLPNRLGFERALERALEAANERERLVAVALLDLDRFNVVNESLGHAAGDELLRELTLRLQRSMRPGDVVARTGSDEFLFLLTDLEDADAARRILGRIFAAFDTSFVLGDREIFVRASAGVALYPNDARESAQLFRLADRAMFDAKARGERVAFYRPPPVRARRPYDRLELEAGLNRAIGRDEFELLYQPQVDVANGTVVGAEALIRWNHPKFGRIMPAAFIRLAEETGLIGAVGAWVVNEACRFGRRWLDAGGPGMVSVNVSPRQFEDEALVDVVRAALGESGLPPDRLWLEITENVITRSPESGAATVARLRELGVRSTIDDFGSGSASFSHLRGFPIDGVKIDETFLMSLGTPAERRVDIAFLRAILEVGRAARLTIVAESVETEQQRDFLVRHGCRLAQGYLFAQPMTPADLLVWKAGAHPEPS